MGFLTRLANSVMRVYLATPKALRWIYWVLPLIYFISPLDFDRLGIFGRLDDILILVFCFWAFERAGRYSGFFNETRTHKANSSKQQPLDDEPEQVQDPYLVLELKQGASAAEIKKAYRRLLSMYHPDKFAHLGSAFEQTAERRTRTIINAYEQLRR